MTEYVGYRVDTSGDLPYACVTIRGLPGGLGDGTHAVLANGAVPWHAAEQMRKVARELTEAADRLDREHPRAAFDVL